MDRSEFIGAKVKQGNDIVFGEEHGAMATTFDMMREIVEGGNSVSTISLELPPAVQGAIDSAHLGQIDQNTFIRQVRMALEQDYLEEAASLLKQEKITQDQYDEYVDLGNERIESILSQDQGSYSEEDIATDNEGLGALYSLIKTSSSAGVDVFATDVGREIVVYSQLGLDTNDLWHERFDDTSDFSLLRQQVDLPNAGQVLMHRGVSHSWNNTGYENKGLDDFLRDEGRSVYTVGVFSNCEVLEAGIEQRLAFGDVTDGSDVAVVDGKLYEASDLDICNNPEQTPTVPLTLAP
jgi:hypothetical protein